MLAHIGGIEIDVNYGRPCRRFSGTNRTEQVAEVVRNTDK